MTIAILDYGSGNLRSVAHAIDHVGGTSEITGVAERVLAADGLVVPGVGHFGACMAGLKDRGLDDAVLRFAATGKPVFGVCVGMQILFEGSQEAPEVEGLGLLPGTNTRLPDGVKVPHMGWNVVTWTDPPHPFVERVPSTRFYFVHSFAPTVSNGVGETVYGDRRFSSAVAGGNVFATQFHPEKSGRWGLALYDAFVRGAAA